MPVPQPLQSRLIGALFVERGLVSESQIRVALELQRETGQQLGQILVERFGVSRKELASVVAEQWAKLGGSAGPEDNASWRRLGEIFVERGFVSQEELDQALERQRQTGERLGEALVAQGVISKFELAGALAEQMAALGEQEQADSAASQPPEATVHHLPRTPEAVDVSFGPLTEESEHLVAVPDTAPEAVPLNLATRLGLVDARPEVAAEPEPEQVEAPVEEAQEPVLDVARDDEAGTPLDDVAVPDMAEPVLEEPVADMVEEPVLAEVAVEEAREVLDDVAAPDVAEPVLGEPVADVVEEPVLAEASVDDLAEPAPTEVAVATGSEVVDDVMPPDVAELVLDPAAANDVGAPEHVLAEVTAEDVPGGYEDLAATEVAEQVLAEAEMDDEHDPVAAEAPVEAPARRPRPLPTLAFEDAPEPETSFACVAYAPTTKGYRLVPLVQIPASGETVDVPDVGERLVLRVGPSPLPHDDRLCAFVEEPVVWALTADAVH